MYSKKSSEGKVSKLVLDWNLLRPFLRSSSAIFIFSTHGTGGCWRNKDDSSWDNEARNLSPWIPEDMIWKVATFYLFLFINLYIFLGWGLFVWSLNCWYAMRKLHRVTIDKESLMIKICYGLHLKAMCLNSAYLVLFWERSF